MTALFDSSTKGKQFSGPQRIGYFWAVVFLEDCLIGDDSTHMHAVDLKKLTISVIFIQLISWDIWSTILKDHQIALQYEQNFALLNWNT